MKYTQEKLNETMNEHKGSLDKMIKTLIEDAMANSESNNFFYCM